MPERSGGPYQRIRRQMFAVLLGFALLPLVAAEVTAFVTIQRELEERTHKTLEAVAKNRRATVELFLEEKLRQLELAATSLPVERLSQAPVLEALRDEMKREGGGIIDLGLIADDGRHVVYVGPYRLHDQDYREQQWFKQVMVLGRYESDVFLGFRRFPHLVLAVRTRAGGRDYVLRATIDSDQLSRLVREGSVETGADVFILNRRGEYQTQYAPSHELMARADVPLVRPHSGVRLGRHHRGGRRELIATAWLRRDAWVLVARHELPGAVAVLRAHPGGVWLLLLGVILAPLGSVLVVRYRLRQLQTLDEERAALYESVAQDQKLATIGRLAAGIAHEINNPLAVIDAQVGVIADGLDESDSVPEAAELRRRISKIRAQIDRGRKVTHRLLGFSRRVGPDIEPVDVQVALDETVSFIEAEAEAAAIVFTRHYDNDAPMIRSSVASMQQVFLNLINNAIDAIGHDGEVVLRVTAADGGVGVTIADNGPGIPAADLKRIFEPFYSTKAGSERHTGLGLAICQEIMHTLGGRITATSEPGHGTTFSLWFPAEVTR